MPRSPTFSSILTLRTTLFASDWFWYKIRKHNEHFKIEATSRTLRALSKAAFPQSCVPIRVHDGEGGARVILADLLLALWLELFRHRKASETCISVSDPTCRSLSRQATFAAFHRAAVDEAAHDHVWAQLVLPRLHNGTWHINGTSPSSPSIPRAPPP